MSAQIVIVTAGKRNVVDAVDRKHHIAAEPKRVLLKTVTTGADACAATGARLTMAGTIAASIVVEIFMFSLPC
jgi:hypothetical protein